MSNMTTINLTLTDARRANARLAIEKAGGVGKVAKKMGYNNPSFLVQQFGPNPTRKPSENTMRKMETALGLSEGSLDNEHGTQTSLPPPPVVNSDLIASVIHSVGAAMGDEHVAGVHPSKHAELINLVLKDALEHGGTPREDHVRALVRLLS